MMSKMAAIPGLFAFGCAILYLFAVCHCNEQEKYQIPVAEYALPYKQTVGVPWPLPQMYIPTSSWYALNDELFQFEATAQTCDILDEAFMRYRFLTFPSTNGETTLRFKNKNPSVKSGDVLDSLQVQVTHTCSPGIYPSMESDESYKLNINDQGAMLVAETVWGALRGLETFSQLVWQDDFGVYKVNYTAVSDFPRFQHRGTLIDTSRHYLSVNKLKEHLDAMSQNKMNVFHWHIVDDQAFPYESYTFPNLSKKGAYTLNHVYTQEDVRELTEYARVRGIRVVPEYDTPGHTQSFGPGQPNLLTKCYSGGKPDGSFGPIDPTLNTTYDFLSAFFKEIAQVYPDQYMHMGGDEVSFTCWKSNPIITQFMQKMSFGTDYAKLEQYYMQKLLELISRFYKGYIIWQEVIDNGVQVRPDTVVEVWKGGFKAELAKVTKLGYKTLLSSCWYLNRISYGVDWHPFYQCDPYDFNGTEAQKKLVIGGETCMWGEYVDDTNLIPRFWPRASAVAERLWSAQSVTDIGLATSRIYEHRCRLLRRGLQVEPINGPSFCKHEVPPRK